MVGHWCHDGMNGGCRRRANVDGDLVGEGVAVEEVEGGEAAVEFPSEDCSCWRCHDDGGTRKNMASTAVESGIVPLRMPVSMKRLVTCADDVRGIEVLDVERACR